MTSSVAGTPNRFWRGRDFWGEAFAVHGSATPRVLPRVMLFGGLAAAVHMASLSGLDLGIGIGPHEIAGAVLGLLLVLRTNAGYERWWEARKLWGGIVNQTRNLAISALSYGPKDAHWQEQIVRVVAAFAHTCRRSLRGERDIPEVSALLGESEAARIVSAHHMPNSVARRIGCLLRDAHEGGGMSGFAFQRAEQERATLIDHLGACERILRTPLPKVYSIKIRRFIVLFLTTLPFALVHKDLGWFSPLVTMLVAYPILSLDLIGAELQNPFAVRNLGHLPLEDLCRTIEGDLLALLAEDSAPNGEPSPAQFVHSERIVSRI